MSLALSTRVGFVPPNTDDMFVVHLLDSGGSRAVCVRSVGQASFEVHLGGGLATLTALVVCDAFEQKLDASRIVSLRAVPNDEGGLDASLLH